MKKAYLTPEEIDNFIIIISRIKAHLTKFNS